MSADLGPEADDRPPSPGPAPRPPWPGQLGEYGGYRLHVRHTPLADGTDDAGTDAANADDPDTDDPDTDDPDTDDPDTDDPDTDDAPAGPLVAVHGLGGAATNWTDLAALLADRWETYAVDLPGFGHSPPPADADLSVAGHVRAVTALVAEVAARHAQRVHLLGSSLGGVVALEVAATRPDLVASLALISPAMPHYSARRQTLRLPLLAGPLVGNVVSRRVADVPAERRVAATLAVCYAEPDRVPAARVAEAVAEATRRGALPYAAAATRASARGLLRTYLSLRQARRTWSLADAVQVPTLLVAGRRDRLVDPAVVDRLARRLPQVRTLSLPDVGHVAQMERPELVAAAVREHLIAAGG